MINKRSGYRAPYNNQTHFLATLSSPPTRPNIEEFGLLKMKYYITVRRSSIRWWKRLEAIDGIHRTEAMHVQKRRKSHMVSTLFSHWVLTRLHTIRNNYGKGQNR